MSIKSKQTLLVKAIISLQFLFFRDSICTALIDAYEAQRELRHVSMEIQKCGKIEIG